MDPEKTYQLRRTALWTAVITAAHFLLGTRTHSFHGAHILFGSLYMFPILTGALGFGLRGGLLTAVVVSGLYSLHILVSWMGQPMANPDQWAMLGAYVFVGVSAGVLVRQAERRKWERDEVIVRSTRSETIRGLTALAAALGARDPETLRHSERVADLCERIAPGVGLNREEKDELRLAALVHDVGKIGVPDDVLFSNGQLDDDQRSRMHEHPAKAAAMIRSIYLGERIATIVEAHHECPDGSGYPKGLLSDQIPLAARILHVADVYDALSEQRRYKGAIDAEQVLDTMQGMTGTKLDSECFAALRAVVVENRMHALRATSTAHRSGADTHA